MKQYNRDEYNLMCAKFLDLDIGHDDMVIDKFGKGHWTKMKFDTDWNWIMEVAKKIYSTIDPSSSRRHDLIAFIGKGAKEQAVKQIWEYLNWYYGKINN
jgi:hypothetical protein